MPIADEKPELQGGTLEKADFDRLGGHLSTYVDLKIAALQNKLAGDMTGLERELLAKLDSKPGNTSLTGHTIAIIVAVVAVLAFGGAAFSGGMSATGVVAQQTIEREQREAEVDRQLMEIRRELRALRRERQSSGARPPN